MEASDTELKAIFKTYNSDQKNEKRLDITKFKWVKKLGKGMVNHLFLSS